MQILPFSLGALTVFLFGVLIAVRTHTAGTQRVIGYILIALAILSLFIPGFTFLSGN